MIAGTQNTRSDPAVSQSSISPMVKKKSNVAKKLKVMKRK
jgi:hypothetical protein